MRSSCCLGVATRPLKLWELSSGACLQTMSGHTAEVTSVCFGGTTRPRFREARDGTIRLWENDDRPLHPTIGRTRQRRCRPCLSRDGDSFSRQAMNRYLRLWECESGRCLCSVPTGMAREAAQFISARPVGHLSSWGTLPRESWTVMELALARRCSVAP